MKFIAYVEQTNTGRVDPEPYDTDKLPSWWWRRHEDPPESSEAMARAIVDYFNSTLRPSEHPRKLIRVENTP